jgi:hypothetical protein
MTKCNDLISNRTNDILVYSSVTQNFFQAKLSSEQLKVLVGGDALLG